MPLLKLGKVGKIQKRLSKFINKRRNRGQDSNSEHVENTGLLADEGNNVYKPYPTTNRSRTAKDAQFEMITAETKEGGEPRDDIDEYDNKGSNNNSDNNYDASIVACCQFYLDDDDAWGPLNGICNFLLFTCCGEESADVVDLKQEKEHQQHYQPPPQVHPTRKRVHKQRNHHDVPPVTAVNHDYNDGCDNLCTYVYPKTQFNNSGRKDRRRSESNTQRMIMRAATYKTGNRNVLC